MRLYTLGFIAGALTSAGLACQVLQILLTGQSRDVNTSFMVLFLTGVILWLYYGLKRQDLILIFWNIIGALLCAAVLALKTVYG